MLLDEAMLRMLAEPAPSAAPTTPEPVAGTPVA
jgi:hypothetical protein